MLGTPVSPVAAKNVIGAWPGGVVKKPSSSSDSVFHSEAPQLEGR